MRGALLGLCHLTVEDFTLSFLEHEMDPLGTKEANVNTQTKVFLTRTVNQIDDGNKLLDKLL